jgi:hypothetical protein
MDWRSLLLGDKTPLIVAAALTVFGWYIDSISRYFANTPVIYVVKTEQADSDDYVLKNVSINQSVENLGLTVQCLGGAACLRSDSPGPADKHVGVVEQVAPFAMGSQSCYQDEKSYQAQVTLPPSASVRIHVTKKPQGKSDLFVIGKYATPCDTGPPSIASVRIETYPSAIAFLLQNFVLYYFVSIVVLVIVFLATIAKLAFPGATAAKGEKDDVPRAIVVDLYIRRNP